MLYVLSKNSNLYVMMNFLKAVRIDFIALSFKKTCSLLKQKEDFTCTPMSPTLPGFPGKPKTPWKDNKNKYSTRGDIFSCFRCSFTVRHGFLCELTKGVPSGWSILSWSISVVSDEKQSLSEESKQWYTEMPAWSCRHHKVSPWPDHKHTAIQYVTSWRLCKEAWSHKGTY